MDNELFYSTLDMDNELLFFTLDFEFSETDLREGSLYGCAGIIGFTKGFLFLYARYYLNHRLIFNFNFLNVAKSMKPRLIAKCERTSITQTYPNKTYSSTSGTASVNDIIQYKIVISKISLKNSIF